MEQGLQGKDLFSTLQLQYHLYVLQRVTQLLLG